MNEFLKNNQSGSIMTSNLHKDLGQTFFHPKLTINQPGDIYEQEADAVAEKVMRTPVHENRFFKPAVNPIQRKCDHCDKEEKKVHMSAEVGASGGMTAPSAVNDVVYSAGQPLDTCTRGFMESRFGYDFANVQVHNDSAAHQSSADINALAYTHGNHVVFGAGQYRPGSDSGKRLLAHELTHVIQQKNMDTLQRKGKEEVEKPAPSGQKKIDLETFRQEHCFGVAVDPSLAECKFEGYNEKVIRLAKQYALRTCYKAIFALEMIPQWYLNDIADLIFHDKPPTRQQIAVTIGKVVQRLEQTPIICKTCHDEECNKGKAMAFVRPEHKFIEICPSFFNKGKLTETPRYLIHEACHLADVDIDNFLTKHNAEGYCNSEDKKPDANDPCPASMDNLTNADAWSVFIVHLAATA